MIEAPVGESGRLLIDLGALRANYRRLCAQIEPAACAAVVKADGYGLGATSAVRGLADEGCRHFFVAHLSEAFAIAAHVPPATRIYVLNGLPPETEGRFSDAGFVPVLNSLAQVDRWAAHARGLGRPLDAALQFDSGMTRLGLSRQDARALAGRPGLEETIRLTLLMSHLACADAPGDPANAQQLARFEEQAGLFPGVARSLANSGGAFLPRAFHQDLVRTGISLFGGAPNNAGDSAMSPVVRLQARVVQTREVSSGTGIGYGMTFRTAGTTRLATLGVGYADGWPRALSNRGAAWLGNRRLPILGRVSMDSMTVDASGLLPDQLAEGDWVDLIGPAYGIDAVARDAGTIPYEILTSLGHRYQRIELH